MNNFTDFIKNELNPEQQKAVKNSSGPLLVIAGAGSGKTRVITARIAYLLNEKQVHPAQIVALTFTNKAATEMKERIKQFLPENSPLPFIGTFHSYCLYLLKINQHLLPIGQFTILDEDDKRIMLNKLLKQSPLYKKSTAQQLSYQISLLKNQCKHPDQELHDFTQNRMLYDLFMAYEKEKRASNCFDFDDLLLEAVKLFDNEQFRNDHQYQVRHILVDEYQDTNVVQHELLKKMGLCTQNNLAVDSVCAVGDEDQSIYSWRGATVDNIIHFQNDFKKTKQIKIEQNYRSKEPILQTANAVISHNKNRNEKKLWSERTGKDCVRILYCLSGYQEADIIARYCKLLFNNKKLYSTAILYRTHFQSRTIEEALIKHAIPYKLIGGIRFYERKEIKDVLAYLRLVINPFDRIAFDRAINCPARGLGDKFVELFTNTWQEHETKNFKEIANLLLEQQIVTGIKADSLKNFVNLFENLTAQTSATETIANLLTKIGYIEHLRKSYEKEEVQERQENIKEFLNAAHFFASQGKRTVEQLLDEVSLLQEMAHEDDEHQDEGYVQLMTLHAAKGLEFDHVILAGLEENLFPSSRSTNEPAQLEEERRLLYVGITRARNKLLITNARYRQTYGQMEEVAPSRFLKEIPAHLAKSEIAASWQQYEVSNYLNQWFGFAQSGPEVFTFSQFIPAQSATKKIIEKKEALLQNTPKSLLKKHQTIKHQTFGIGIIKEIEEKSSRTIITAQFKIGVKKLDAKFIQTV